jgi:hypothetical protein
VVDEYGHTRQYKQWLRADVYTGRCSCCHHDDLSYFLYCSGITPYPIDLLIVLDTIPEGDTYSPLKEALLYWYGSEFDGQSAVYPTPVAELYSVLNSVLLDDGTAYNMEIAYLDDDDQWESRALLWNGRPSDNAVLVTRKVVIHNEDRTYLVDNCHNNSWIVQNVLPDRSSNTDFFNILDVRLTLWRM